MKIVKTICDRCGAELPGSTATELRVTHGKQLLLHVGNAVPDLCEECACALVHWFEKICWCCDQPIEKHHPRPHEHD